MTSSNQPVRLLSRKLVNRTHGYNVNFLISAAETGGDYTYVEVDLPPGEGTPLHYHLHFDEQFEAVEGVLGIETGKKIIHVRPGDRPAVALRGVVHRFFNPGTEFIKFRAVIAPARQFETLMRIGYGLADDGLCNKKGLPKSIWHLALVYQIGESFLPGMPLFFQRGIFGLLARIARLKGKDKELEKYYLGTLEPQQPLPFGNHSMLQPFLETVTEEAHTVLI